MNTLKLEKLILKNNKMAKMLGAMAKAHIRGTERSDRVIALMNDIILNPREVVDFESAVSLQSSMLLDMLVLYNEYTSDYTEIMEEVRRIRHLDESSKIIMNAECEIEK